MPFAKMLDNQRHYHTTTKTTPTNADQQNPKSTRNKKNIMLEMKSAVLKTASKKSAGKDKRALSDKQMTVSTVHRWIWLLLVRSLRCKLVY